MSDEIERLKAALDLAGHTPAQFPTLTDVARGHSFISKEWGQKAEGGHWSYTQNRETQGCYICAMMHEIETQRELLRDLELLLSTSVDIPPTDYLARLLSRVRNHIKQ